MNHGYRLRGNAFAATGKAELFSGCRLYGDTIMRDPGNAGYPCLDGGTMGPDLGCFADDGEIEMGDHAAAPVHQVDGMKQELVRCRVAPAHVTGRKMFADIASRQCTEQCIGQGMQGNIRIGMAG